MKYPKFSLLFEEAVIPVVLALGVKIIALLFINVIFSLSWQVVPKKILGILPSIFYSHWQEFMFANTYSNVAVFLVIFFGAAFVVVRGHFFHKDHVHPKFHARILSSRIHWILSDSIKIYHQAAVWFLFLGIFTLYLTIEGFLGSSFFWLWSFSLPLTLLLLAIFVLDIHREITTSSSGSKPVNHK